MNPPPKKPPEPTFIRGMIGAAIPLAAAVAVASICGFLIYIFWFGTEWIINGLFN